MNDATANRVHLVNRGGEGAADIVSAAGVKGQDNMACVENPGPEVRRTARRRDCPAGLSRLPGTGGGLPRPTPSGGRYFE
ncbi:MAG TPA: hypothetical protein PKK06_16685 [Phycisphaerae bacterium]|nr:hypothetical protein [Phycisphaerae bacterium]HNU46922.1 hypothetical protein [Phycisphaerae bacterium]